MKWYEWTLAITWCYKVLLRNISCLIGDWWWLIYPPGNSMNNWYTASLTFVAQQIYSRIGSVSTDWSSSRADTYPNDLFLLPVLLKFHSNRLITHGANWDFHLRLTVCVRGKESQRLTLDQVTDLPGHSRESAPKVEGQTGLVLACDPHDPVGPLTPEGPVYTCCVCVEGNVWR